MIGPDEAPVRRRYVCSKDGKALDADDIVRGYEIEKGKFVVVTDEELEAVEPRKSREIDLRLFVDEDDIDPIYFERAYFLVPTGGTNKAYRLLAEVMEKKKQAGIATFVMRAKIGRASCRDRARVENVASVTAKSWAWNKLN